MNSRGYQALRIHLALLLLSAALIGFQLEQMQLLALVQWHHFAYFIISVALLGFGTAGTCVALWRNILLDNLKWLLPLLMFGCAFMMALALPLSQSLVGGFDISLVFVDANQAGRLLLGQFVYLLVFFLGALPLGLIFIHHSASIGSLYCANMSGSGLGSVLAVILMYLLLPQELPGLTALLPWAAGLLVIPKDRPLLLLPGGAVLAVLIIVILHPPAVTPSQYKAISRTLAMPGAKVVTNRPSALGLVQRVTAPALRYAPGLSLTYREEVPPVPGVVFSNGDWFGAMSTGDASLRNASAAALPYALSRRDRVLVLEAGTGADVLQALDNGAMEVVAVEPHRRALTAASSSVGNGTGFFGDPAVRLSFMASRTWLALSRDHYDLITLPAVGTFGGSSGLFALQEQFLLTREGLHAMWERLSAEGILRISAWLDSPPRNSLRLTASVVEMLEEGGMNFSSHVAAVRGWDMITFIIKRSPLTVQDEDRIRRFCAELQFDPVFLPGLTPGERERYHLTTDPDFFSRLDYLLIARQREALYQEYPFNLRPVSDNRPFFSQFLRWQSVPHLIRLLGDRTMPYLELGYTVVLAGFVQMTAVAVLLILLPLFRLGLPGTPGGAQGWTIPFFSGIGLGYMFFEIVMIHELVLFLGHPIFAAAAVISSLLIFSGMGSLFSGRLPNTRPVLALAAGLTTLLLLLYSFVLLPFLHHAIAWQAAWKILLVMALIAPPAFVMGMPFPLGLGRLAGFSKNQAAWAWGINGCVSVVSTALAAIVAVEFGFSSVMMTACAAYALAALAGWKS